MPSPHDVIHAQHHKKLSFMPSKKFKVSDRLVSSRTVIWEAYSIIATFVPIVIMSNLQKMVGFAQDTQTIFLMGALFCLYLFLAYKHFTYRRQYKISTCFACNTHFKEHYARLFKKTIEITKS
jgi:Mn2+/Fe2+ NRAMP family transporter